MEAGAGPPPPPPPARRAGRELGGAVTGGGGPPPPARAGDLREEHVAQHVHLGERPPHPADERLAEVDEPVRDSRSVHDRGCEDEQRDRDEREACRSLVERHRHVGQARDSLRRDHRDDRRDAERHGDRDVDQHQHEDAKHDEEPGHASTPAAACSRRASRSTSGKTSSWPRMNMTAPIGITEIAYASETSGRETSRSSARISRTE